MMWVLICAFSLGGIAESAEQQSMLTLDDVFRMGITTVVDQDIVLRSKVTWYNTTRMLAPPAKPVSDFFDTLVAGPLTLNFESGDDYVDERFVGQERGNIVIVSDELSTAFDDVVEEYYFRGVLLDKDRVYLLHGQLRYRSDSPPIDNPAFIEQSNSSTTYWSQTFTFQLKELFELPPPLSIDNASWGQVKLTRP